MKVLVDMSDIPKIGPVLEFLGCSRISVSVPQGNKYQSRQVVKNKERARRLAKMNKVEGI